MNYITSENILLIGSTLLVAGVLFGKTSYKIGLPLLLVFLIVGMGFGTDGLGVQFSDMHTAQFIGMIALCIILFSGGMGTKVSSIRPVLLPGLVLSTAGVLLTALITGFLSGGSPACHGLISISPCYLRFCLRPLCLQPIPHRFSAYLEVRKSDCVTICAPCLNWKAVPTTPWHICSPSS